MAITLKQARIGANLTQSEIARKLNVSTVTYAKYELNPKSMKIETALHFCKICNVEFDNLLFYENVPLYINGQKNFF